MKWLISCSDEVDLQGYSKRLGSCKDFTTSKGAVTSWCVQKWEEAGVVVLGKLNMHELGLGMIKSFYRFTSSHREITASLIE